MAAELPRPGIEVIQTFQSVSPTVITPTLVPSIVGACYQVVSVLTTSSTGAQQLNSQAQVPLHAILESLAGSGSPPVYSGLNGLDLVLSLNNGPALSIAFSGTPLSPAQVVAQVLLAFSAGGITAFTAEVIEGGTSWQIRSLAADPYQSIQVLSSSAPAVLAAFGFAAGKEVFGATYYTQDITQIGLASFPNPNNNLTQLSIIPSSERAFLFLGGTGAGSALAELLQTSSFLENGASTPAVLTGTIDMTTLTYGTGGTLNGLTLSLTINGASSPLVTTFANPANLAAALAQINAVISAVATASVNASNHLVITDLTTGASATITLNASTAATALGLTVPTTVTGGNAVAAIDSGNGTSLTPLLQFAGANFTASPGSGAITGTTVIPTGGVADGLTLQLDDGTGPQTLSFLGATTRALVLSQINALFGTAAGGRTLATLSGANNLVLTNTALGVESVMKVLGGTALTALGLTAGAVARGTPFVPMPGDSLYVNGALYATITQVAPGGNVNQLKINQQVPINANVGSTWYIVANGLSATATSNGVTRPTPNLSLDSFGNMTIKPEVIRDTNGNPVLTSRAQLYVSYKALRLDVTALATSPALLTFSDTTTLTSNLSPITTDNPLGLGFYFALLNAPGIQVTGLGVDAISGDEPNGTVEAFTRAATFLEGYEVYAIAPLTHDETVNQVFNTHVTFMSDPANKGERIVLINSSTPTNKVDTLVASGTDGNSGTSSNVFDTGVANLGSLLLAQGLTGTGPYVTANGIYLDIGDGNHYNIINVVGSVVTCKTTGFLPGENDDGYYATVTLPTGLIEETFAVRIRGAALVLSDGTPDKDGIAATMQTIAAGYANRRVWNIFPDKCSATIGGIQQIIDGFYMTAGIAGLIAGQPPQQSFTNFPMTGYVGVVGSNDTFSTPQLDTIAGGGNYIIVQDAPATPLIARMALTTDLTSVETRTDSITKIVDFCAKFLRQGLKNFIGRFNITQGFLDSLGHVIQGLLGFLTESGVLIGATLNSIVQDTTEPDTVLVSVILDVPYPCNYIKLTLVV